MKPAKGNRKQSVECAGCMGKKKITVIDCKTFKAEVVNCPSCNGKGTILVPRR